MYAQTRSVVIYKCHLFVSVYVYACVRAICGPCGRASMRACMYVRKACSLEPFLQYITDSDPRSPADLFIFSLVVCRLRERSTASVQENRTGYFWSSYLPLYSLHYPSTTNMYYSLVAVLFIDFVSVETSAV